MPEPASNLPVPLSPAPKGKAGRPRGRREDYVARLTRVRANELLRDGESPLDVMADNMLFWHRRVPVLEGQAKELYLEAITLKPATEEERKKKYDLLERAIAMQELFVNARDKSQSCAVDAAPYCHARIQAVVGKIQHEHTHEDIKDDTDPKKAAEIYANELVNGAIDS